MTKSVLQCACAAVLLGGISLAAHAENKLFPTDVLGANQADVSVTLHGSQSKHDFVYVPMEDPGTSKDHISTLTAEMRYGVTASLTIGGTVIGADNRSTTTYPNHQWRGDSAHSGIEGESIFAKYAFIGDQNAPMTLAGQVTATTYGGNLGGNGYNVLRTQLMAGWHCGEGVRSYATLGFAVPDRAQVAKSESASVGSWITLSDSVTLIPSASFTHSQQTSDATSVNSYGLGLAGLIAVGQNSYVRPSVGISKTAARDFGNFHDDAATGQNASIEFYQLF